MAKDGSKTISSRSFVNTPKKILESVNCSENLSFIPGQQRHRSRDKAAVILTAKKISFLK
jgi:hypothetical protein